MALRKLLISGLLLFATTAQPQTTFGTLLGVVTDPSGAVVPGAKVHVADAVMGISHEVEANQTGNYTVGQLKEGEYTLEVSAPGFQRYSESGIVIAARDIRRVDVRLVIGDTGTRVEVTAEAGLIETETSRISKTRSSQDLASLPVPSRSIRNFIVLSPTVVQSETGDNRIHVGGSQYTQNEFTIDGISANNGYNGNSNPELTDFIESFEEVRIDSSNNTADIGAMGQITLISKSGNNLFHGSAFDYYTSPVFRSRNPFAQERGSGTIHFPGFSAGGPVVLPKLYKGKDKTFFFLSYEDETGGGSSKLLSAGVPLAAWRQGDFSTTKIKDPTTQLPFQDNVIPTSRINPVSRAIQDRFYPLPNYGSPDVFQTGNFRLVAGKPFDGVYYATVRLDHRLSARQSLYARGTYNRAMFHQVEGQVPTLGLRWRRRDTRNLVVSYSFVASSSFLNEIRGGGTYGNTPRSGPQMGKALVQEWGLVGLADNLPDVSGMPRIQWSGLGITNLNQDNWEKPGFLTQSAQIQDQASWYKGKHGVKFGANIQKIWFLDTQEPNALFGQVQFTNTGYTGNAYADFLLGLPTNCLRAFPAIDVRQYRWSHDFFVADDYKISSRLTLNLGLRYELHPGWTATNGLQSVFDIASGRIVVPDGMLSKVSSLMPINYVGVVEAHQAGLPSSLVRTDRNNFAPRLGFAWRPLGPHTVFRGGFSVFYDLVNHPPDTGVPFQMQEPTYVNPQPNAVVVLPRVFPATAAGPTSVTLPTAINPNLQIPYSMQYSFTVQHQRWGTGFRASYLGAATRHGEWSLNINQPLPDARPYVTKPRAFPQFPQINYITNGAGHQYHGLTLEAERRFSKGLQYNLAWIWQRDLRDVERGKSPENAYDLARERGPAIEIPTHRVTGSVIYELPLGKRRRFLSGNSFVDAFAGGWNVSMTAILATGQFLSPAWSGRDPTGTVYTASNTAASVNIRPDVLRNPNLPADERTISRWFDLGAFGAPAAGRFGTAGPGLIIGPGTSVFNAGVYKQFSIRERLRLRIELTGNNIFNHPNYANPSTDVTSAGQGGVLTAIRTTIDMASQRELRTGLRLDW